MTFGVCWFRGSAIPALAALIVSWPGAASSGPLALVDPGNSTASIFEPILRDQQPSLDSMADSDVPSHLRRQVISYSTREKPGTIVIDTADTHLYLVLEGGRAIRYAIGVGREGFTWSGVQSVSRKAEWPDWTPPAEMIRRQQYLPRWVAGGPGNPLGARAMYLGNTQYRIHGTNDPTTIGKKVSSGCIRLTNEDVVDLYGRVTLGAKVVVLQGGRGTPTDAFALSVGRAPQPVRTSNSPPSQPTRTKGAVAFGLY